jgi:tetratricopeptide (TPR) repeat protein
MLPVSRRVILNVWTAMSTIALVGALSNSIQGQPSTLTFTEHIAPILYHNCVACHRDGGSAPFSLVTYEDVRPRARQIAVVTRQRLMPPWKPVAGYGPPMHGERRLTEQQITAIQSWVRDGAREGPLRALPKAPRLDGGWQLGHPDLVIGMPQPYRVQAGGRDVFRQFVLQVPLTETRYVKGFELRSTNEQMAHHATIRIDKTNASLRLDERDPAPGYSGAAAPSAVYPDGYILAWTPGQSAPFLPQGMSWRLEPGDSVVVQLHIVPTEREELLQFRLGFYFTSGPPQRMPVTLRLSRQDIDIAPGEKRYLLTDEYVLPVDVDVLAVQPHAHYLAREIKAFVDVPQSGRVWLLYIDKWDFHWQDVYRYENPIRLPKGSIVHIEYRYDNSVGSSRNQREPTRRVRFGEDTEDEMGLLWVQVMPVKSGDVPILTRDSQRKELLEDVTGYQKRLEVESADYEAHAGLVKSYLDLGDVAEALAHATEAVTLRPMHADAHYNLGTVLVEAGQLEAAARQFTQAIDIDSSDASAHNSLGVVFLAMHRVDDALKEFLEAVRLDPRYTKARNNVAMARREKARRVDVR